MSEVTATKRQPVGFKKIKPEHGKETRFTSDNQPNKAKSEGWAKKRMLKNLLNIVTNKKFNLNQKSDWRKLAAAFFNIPEDHVTIETMMEFRQLEKAINSGDTAAYNAIKDRVYGKPKQSLDIDADVNFEAEVYIGRKKIRKD